MAGTIHRLCAWRAAKGLAFEAQFETGEHAAVLLRVADKFRATVDLDAADVAGVLADQAESLTVRTA